MTRQYKKCVGNKYKQRSLFHKQIVKNIVCN